MAESVVLGIFLLIYLLFLVMKNPQNLVFIVKLLVISKIPVFVARACKLKQPNKWFLEMAGLRCVNYQDKKLRNQALTLARVSRNLHPRNLHILERSRPTDTTRNLHVMVCYFKMKPLLEVRYPHELK